MKNQQFKIAELYTHLYYCINCRALSVFCDYFFRHNSQRKEPPTVTQFQYRKNTNPFTVLYSILPHAPGFLVKYRM